MINCRTDQAIRIALQHKNFKNDLVSHFHHSGSGEALENRRGAASAW
jgi:hypothetical protein